MKSVIKIILLLALGLNCHSVQTQGSDLTEKQNQVYFDGVSEAVTHLDELQTTFILRRFLFRHDLKKILDSVRRKTKFTMKDLNEFKERVVSLEKVIIVNEAVDPVVKLKAKETITRSVNAINESINNFELFKVKSHSLKTIQETKKLSNENLDLIKKKFESREEFYIDQVESSKKELKKKATSEVVYITFLVLISSLALYVFIFRNKSKRLMEKLGNTDKSVNDENKALDILPELSMTMVATVDLEGNIITCSKPFNDYFKERFELKEVTWDDFFNKEFTPKMYGKKKAVGEFVFHKDPLANFNISTKITKNGQYRLLEIIRTDVIKMDMLIGDLNSSLKAGKVFAMDVFDQAMVACSHEIAGIKVSFDEDESKDLIAYLDRNILLGLFKNFISLCATMVSTVGENIEIVITLSREDSQLKINALIPNWNVTDKLDTQAMARLKEVSDLMAKDNGEINVSFVTEEDKTKLLMKLNIRDEETALKMDERMIFNDQSIC